MANLYTGTKILSKKLCPYMERCYRKNPIHFNEMSHPHLEKIVKSQLEGEIQIPADLDFECSDRSLLIDQLKVLQIVLRKEKNSRYSTSDNESVNSSNITVTNDSSKVNQSLKDRVERHKQGTSRRREAKLEKMDEEAEALFTSQDKGIVDKSNVSKMKEELNNLKIVEESTERSSCCKDRKRNSTSSDENDSGKKSKSSYGKFDKETGESMEDISTCLGSTQSSSSSEGTSVMEHFQSCSSAQSRKKVRDKAIKMLKKQGFEVTLEEPGNFAMKYALSAPYHLFFTQIQKSKATYNQQSTITFPEILDISLGEIACSLQINFMVDVGWLCLQYLLAGQRTDMLILYGERLDEEKVGLNITLLEVEMPQKFACHHSKIMILKYKNDGIRVVVSTANLYSDDWENRTQGLWISPHLPPLPESANPSDGESPTGFKKDLECYLNKYRQPSLTEWTSAVRRADFSSVNVFFVASVPGKYTREEYDWGHRKLGCVLSKHAKLPPDAPRWTLVAQSSSIGAFGPSFEGWLQKDIVSSMSKENPLSLKSLPNFQFIYPTINNYRESFDCRVGSCCFPYSLEVHSKQQWLEPYLYEWKATRTARDRAMPHIKSYTRFSPDFKKVPWFVLTSANLSKAAWGNTYKNSFVIRNYEAGVIFIPKFVTGSTTFPIQEEEAGVPVFPIIYDLPPTKYKSDDKPFIMELFHS